MSFEPIIFLALATMLVIAAGAVVTLRNPVHAAMSLVLTFFTSAMLWILLRAEFLGITLVLVYVGAVMVLFLFVVMMLDINVAPLREGFARYLPVGILVAAIMAAEMVAVLGSRHFGLDKFAAPAPVIEGSNTEALGRLLYTDYVYPFEIAAVILLVAIIAAIALTHRRREGVKTQDPSKQTMVRKADRLRVVKMPSDSKEGHGA
ncbi:MAG: NADH-quinone oxidoreductase subunit J [Rhodanobacteraceae bacterium]|nr:NADH-quinone oxidoreductase subunit J [Rhodanobacteraceae bacterium]